MKFLPGRFSWIWWNVLKAILSILSKDFSISGSNTESFPPVPSISQNKYQLRIPVKDPGCGSRIVDSEFLLLCRKREYGEVILKKSLFIMRMQENRFEFEAGCGND